jgi:hypothetical protein
MFNFKHELDKESGYEIFYFFFNFILKLYLIIIRVAFRLAHSIESHQGKSHLLNFKSELGK